MDEDCIGTIKSLCRKAHRRLLEVRVLARWSLRLRTLQPKRVKNHGLGAHRRTWKPYMDFREHVPYMVFWMTVLRAVGGAMTQISQSLVNVCNSCSLWRLWDCIGSQSSHGHRWKLTAPLHAFEDLQHQFQPQAAPGDQTKGTTKNLQAFERENHRKTVGKP